MVVLTVGTGSLRHKTGRGSCDLLRAITSRARSADLGSRPQMVAWDRLIPNADALASIEPKTKMVPGTGFEPARLLGIGS